MVAFGGSVTGRLPYITRRCLAPPGSSCPPSTRWRTSRRSWPGRASVLAQAAPAGFRILVVDDESPDGTGRAGRPPGRGARRRRGAAPPGPSRPRPGLPGRLRPRAGGRRQRGLRDGRRPLARPRRPRPPAGRGARGRRRPRARLALRARRRRAPTGACCGGSSAGAGRSTPGRCSRVDVEDLTGGFKCFRREVLEAIDLSTVRVVRLRVPGRADLPRRAGGLPRRRGADHLPQPRARDARRCRRGSRWEAILLLPAAAPARRSPGARGARRPAAPPQGGERGEAAEPAEAPR